MKHIYAIQNQINSKLYIGITVDIQQRWYSHQSCAKHPEWKNKHYYIHSAINKYGADSFVIIKLESFDNAQEALDAEQFWIEFFRTDINRFGKEYGYNLTAGGEGAWGRKNTPEHNKKIGNSLLGNTNALGTIHTNETLNKMSISHQGAKNHKAQITEQNVRDIRQFHKENITNQNLDIFKYLSEKYHLSISGLEKIIYKKTWKHIY